MLKLEQALLVEGKYDAARLSNIVDGTILTTDGFRVFTSSVTVPSRLTISFVIVL